MISEILSTDPKPTSASPNQLLIEADTGAIYRWSNSAWERKTATYTPVGAKGDGVTDDTAAIQEALDLINSLGGGTIYIPEGTYIISDHDNTDDICLIPYSNIKIVGVGIGNTILKIADSETGPVSVFENTGTINNFEISNIEIDGNKTRVASTEWGVLEHEGIDLKSPTNCWVHHMYIHDVATDGIDLDLPDHCIVSDCRIEDCGGCAVHGSGSDCIITKISSKGNSYYRLQSTEASVRLASGAISFSGPRHIFSEISSYQDDRGISLEDPTRCSISNVTIYQPGAGSNITGTTEIDPVTNNYSLTNTVSGGTAPTGGGCGIYINQGTQTSISNCNIEMRNTLVCNAIQIAGNSATRHTISGCSCSSGRSVLYLNGCNQANINGSTFANGNSLYNAIVSNNKGEINFTGCSFVNGNTGGVRCQNACEDITFSSCMASGNQGDGFSILASVGNVMNNITVVASTASNNTSSGIQFQNNGAAPTNCNALVNNVTGNTGNNIDDAGTATTLTSNVGWP